MARTAEQLKRLQREIQALKKRVAALERGTNSKRRAAKPQPVAPRAHKRALSGQAENIGDAPIANILPATLRDLERLAKEEDPQNIQAALEFLAGQVYDLSQHVRQKFPQLSQEEAEFMALGVLKTM